MRDGRARVPCGNGRRLLESRRCARGSRRRKNPDARDLVHHRAGAARGREAGSQRGDGTRTATRRRTEIIFPMNVARAQRRIVLYVLLPALALYLGLRLFAQYRHVDVYVSRQAPMPAELAAGLHMEEHRIDPTVTIESPYDSAPEKILTPAEIRKLRSAIAWSSAMPAFIDSLSIQ